MSQRRHGLARTRIGNLPRPASAGAVVRCEEPAAAKPQSALEKIRSQGNRATARWLSSSSTIRMDGAGERAADALARALRTGQGTSRGMQDPHAVMRAADLKPRVQSLVRSAIARRGAGLPAAVRRRAETHAGFDLEDVEVHTGAEAEAAANALSARAFTFGAHLVFGHGEYAPHSARGEELLTHELAHALLQRQARTTVVQRWDRAGRNPFGPVLSEIDLNIYELDAFLTEIEDVRSPSMLFGRELNNLRMALLDVRAERDATRRLAEDSATPVVEAGVSAGSAVLAGTVEADVYERVRGMYFGTDTDLTAAPDAHNLAVRYAQLERGINLMRTIRPTVLNLINGLSADSSVAQREVTLDVVSYYLQCGVLRESDALAQLAFLDVFYADPVIILLYAAVREGARALPDLLRNEASIATSMHAIDEVGLGAEIARDFEEAQRIRARMQTYVEQFGDPPRGPQAIRELPTAPYAVWFGGALRYFSIAHPIVAMWIPTKYVQDMMSRSLYAGTSLLPGESDRTRWSAEIQDLFDTFRLEFREADHPRAGFEARIAGYEPRVQRLLDEIPAAVRRRRIAASIAEQIPFMFVGGAIAGGVGRFVSGITGGSRWLIAIAEGTTFTALGAVALPAAMRPTTASGWAVHLALNIGWARVGRALFEAGANWANGMANTRSAIARASLEVAMPTLGMTALQTGAQLIEAHAMGAGGETSVVEALTVNFVMNALGVMCGAAMNAHLVSDAPPTAAALARSAGIDEAAAQRWLDLAARNATFAEDLVRLGELARAGTLTSEQFEALKARGAALADEMEATLPDLAEALRMNRTPAEIRAAIAAFRARLAGLTYSPHETVTALLPEFTGGLTRVNEVTFVYDAANPPAGLETLRASMAEHYTVRDRPGGGFEAVNAEGRIVAQVMPASGASLAALPISLSVLARGPQAQAGLALVRAQTAEPQLEALLAAAGGRSGEATVRVLRVLGRQIEATDALALRGLANYLRNGGNPEALARLISHPSSREFSAEAQLRARRNLRRMSIWDAEAVRGLEALFRVRSGIEGERLDTLFGDYEPEQVCGILQSIALLEPASRGLRRLVGALTSGNESQRRGAMGALTAAVQLIEENPGRMLIFEEPVFERESGRLIRVQDITMVEIVDGVERTVATIEVKEISTANLGSRGPHQFAIDMLLDSLARATPSGTGGVRSPFETFRWMIRRAELQAQAARNLGLSDVTDPRVEPEMRRIVERMLEPAFDDPDLRTMPEDQRAAYRAAFRGVPFVRFF